MCPLLCRKACRLRQRRSKSDTLELAALSVLVGGAASTAEYISATTRMLDEVPGSTQSAANDRADVVSCGACLHTINLETRCCVIFSKGRISSPVGDVRNGFGPLGL